MIDTTSKKVQINQIVKSQLPSFVSEENPLFVDFLKQSYISQEFQGGSIDIISNLNQYQKVETFSGNENLIGFTTCTTDVTSYDTVINVTSTDGWPDKYGLLKINDEIITYTGITTNSFTGCIRGFSGVENLHKSNQPETLVFTETDADSHVSSTRVLNLSNLFLQEFWKKTKTQFLPGFEDRKLDNAVDKANFLRQAKDFYASKGTDEAIKILFSVLYNVRAEVIKPIEYLISPSDADYVITYDLVAELISGDPIKTIGQTLYQTTDDGVKGSIFNVQYYPKDNKSYYIISLSRNSIVGEFSATGSSALTNSVSIGATVLTVDSTIGFEDSGTIYVGTGQTVGIATYLRKTSTQFFGVSGITSAYTDGQIVRSNNTIVSYEDGDLQKPVYFRLTPVVSSPSLDNAGFLSVDDLIGSKTLGNVSNPSNYLLNSWIHNIKTKSNVAKDFATNTSLVNVATNTITTVTPHLLRLDDNVTLLDQTSNIPSNVVGKVNQIIDSNTFVISISSGSLSVSRSYIVRRELLFASSNNNSVQISNFIADVQNTYSSIDDSNVYVTSGSLPSYKIYATDRKKTFTSSNIGDNIITINNHGFYSGDLVTYYPETSIVAGLSTGSRYVVTRLDGNRIKLSLSSTDASLQRYLTLGSGGTNHTITPSDLYDKNLVHQNFLREFPVVPKLKDVENPLENENVGMFLNGVEIISNRSGENIFYGNLTDIIVENGGSGYDVITPPNINISDTVGSGATAYCVVENGSFESINVTYPGYDLRGVPSITITGGNGSGATASARLRPVRNTKAFDSNSEVNLNENIIGFSTSHLFYNGESVIYQKAVGLGSIGGLVDSSVYYVHRFSDTQVKLMSTYDDAVVGINTINITSRSTGTGTLVSTTYRNVLDNVVINDPGSGYSNRRILVTSSNYPPEDYVNIDVVNSGINTSDDYIFFKSHGFNTGDIVEYRTTGTSISGLSTTQNYYVSVVDENSFKLASAGIGTTASRVSFDKKDFIDIRSVGVGTHTFKYPDISVTVETISGTANTSLSLPRIRPICSGNITDVYLTNVGSGYGSSEVHSIHRRPLTTVSNGSSGVIDIVVNNGEIINATVKVSGGGYVTPPTLNVVGDGKYAKLVANISKGKITDVTIVDSGKGYTQQKTSVVVTPVGSGAKLLTNVRKWEIDVAQKYKSIVNENDDGIITQSQNANYGTKYVNAYLPRKLRLGLNDNIESNYSEKTTLRHSPIVGWSYDGCPIYGPYGYSTRTGGTVRRMVPSYTLSSKNNRPPVSVYPLGFFIEDWDYTADGDLDQYNGRFCKTPEFPNGVYAYFCTIKSSNSSTSPFINNREPIFPYVLNGYKFKVNDFNQNPSSIQNLDILNSGKVVRNTYPYKFGFSNSNYDYLSRNNLKDTAVIVRSIKKVGINTITVVEQGSDYKVGDSVIFNNTNSGGDALSAEVKTLVGKGITEISYTEVKVPNISFTIKNEVVTGVSTVPHNLSDKDIVIIDELGEGELKFIEGLRTISVSTVTSKLDVGIGTSGTTGIVTTISLSDSATITPEIYVDDILKIGNETLTVLSRDPISNTYRVRRQAGLVTTHDAGDSLYVDQSRFTFEAGIKTSLTTFPDRKIVFNPQNSIGIGTTVVVQSVAGVGTTTYVRVKSFDGTVLSDHTLPPSGSTADNLISITNHGLKSGDKLTYRAGPTGYALTVSNNLDLSNSFDLINDQTVYAVKHSNNLLGITTTKAGIGSTTTSLYFLPIGSQNGVEHSFTTLNTQYVGSVKRYDVTVKTVSDHTLNSGDIVTTNILPNLETTEFVEFDSTSRKTITNPDYFNTASVGVGTTNSKITISNHSYSSGDKILYVSSDPITPLVNNGQYFVQKLTNDVIRLSTNYVDATKIGGQYIGITSYGSGVHKISKINPHISAIRGQTIGFAVSDSSVQNFELEFYEDQNFENKYEGFGISTEITRSGTPGSSGAVVKLQLSNNVPTPLYYRLNPKNLDIISSNKRDSKPDDSVINGSKIIIGDSAYSGVFGITTTSNTTFKYQTNKIPESSSYVYTSGITTFRYTTDSTFAVGGINEIDVSFPGLNYERSPGIGTISTNSGNNGILRVYDENLGTSSYTEILKTGYDYPSDKSLKPKIDTPIAITLSNNYSLRGVNVVTGGRNYLSAPDLIVIGHPEATLRANLDGTSVSSVDVLNVGRGLNENPGSVRIVSVRNSNGVGIVTASSSGTTNILKIEQPTNGWRADGLDFPFKVGDRIFVEGIGLTTSLSSTGGYNSDDYDYRFFTVATVTPLDSQITYSISGIGTFGGIYDPDNSIGRVIKQNDLPTFSALINPDEFYFGEKVTYNSNSTAFVLENKGYDPLTNTIRLRSTTSSIKNGDVVKGFNSGSEGTVINVESSNIYFETGYRAEKVKGWQRDTGKLNDDFQKLPDNDYYQNFSYSIKSPIQESTWKEPVTNIVHTSGYKKFSDMVIPSSPSVGVGRSNTLKVSSAISDTSLIINIDNLKSFSTRDDFDYASETVLSNGVSKLINFQNKKITSFINVISNVVNQIDDISSSFTGIGTTTSAQYVGLSTFKLTENGTTLFNKVFDGSDSNVISVGSSVLRINNHNFQTGERIKYDPGNGYDSNRIGIETTNKVLGGITTDFMPAEVYAIRIDNNQFKIAGLNTAVTNNEPFVFRSVGTGTSHSFDTINADSRVLISIDGIVQSPLYRKNIDVALSEAVGVGSTTIKVVGVTSVTTNDLFNIDNEILRVDVVGFGSTNVITVERGVFGSVAAAHTVGAAVTVRSGDFHTVKDVIYFIDPPYGPTGVSTLQPGIGTQSTFKGRIFNRNNPTTNFVFDDLSDKFTGVGKTFTLLQDTQDVTGIVTTITGEGSNDEVINNGIILINNFVQRQDIDYTMDEKQSPGIGASIFFSGTSSTDLPRGGKVGEVTVGIGSGYQPLIPAAATAVINGSGSIESVTVTGGGSGYRSSTSVDIQVLNPLGIGSTAVLQATVGSAGTVTGITTISGGSGYASTNPPILIVGIPTAYSNVEFTGGQGSGFKATIIVGSGGSVIDFNITERGFGYENNDVLTVAGIPTDPNVGAGFSAITFTVNSRIDDKFSGFSFGQLIRLDDFSDQFNGSRKVFTLTKTTVTKDVINIGTDLTNYNLANNLLVFINDVLQQPDEAYKFNGGTQIEFTEAPKSGSKLQLLFFRGSNSDVASGDPFETIRVGDNVILQRNGNYVQQSPRRVTKITGISEVQTNPYFGVGINNDPTFTRISSWQKQTSDLIIDNQALPKSRKSLLCKIHPTTRIIQNVGINSDVIFVENAFPLFSAYDNRIDRNSVTRGSIKIVNVRDVDRADGTVSVSVGGTLVNPVVTDPGAGYDTVPTVRFNPSKPQIFEIGKNWTQSSSNTDIEYQDVHFTDFGMFVAVGSTSGINTSTDGITWADSGVSGFDNFNAVTSSSNNVIVVGSGGTIAVSVDRGGSYNASTIYTRSLSGFLYTYTDTTISQDLNDIVVGPTKAVAVGAAGTIVYSTDGPTGFGTGFIIGNKYTSQNLNGVDVNGNTFVAVGNGGVILRSIGGETWSGVTTPSITTNLKDVYYGDNKWIAVGAAGTIIRSIDDGLTWSVVSAGSTFDLNSIIYQDNVWVAIGQSGNVLNSIETNTWYKKSVGVTTDYNALAYGDTKLVTVGLSSNIAYSQFARVSAAATATVSAAGTITSINITDGGFGYDSSSTVEVLFSIDPATVEIITSVDCDGDFGTVVGVGTSATGIGTDSPMVKFELDADPFLNQQGFGDIDKSGILEGYYFVIHDSVVGNGLTSINKDASVIGIGTSFIDNVYRADEVVTSNSGIVTVYSNVQSLAGLGTISLSPRIGYYSWGRFYGFVRDVLNPQSFGVNNQNGYTGITTAPIVYRITPMIENYSDFDQTS